MICNTARHLNRVLVVPAVLAFIIGAPIAAAQSMVEITAGDLLATPSPTAGVAWVDVDRDGDHDLFIANGNLVSNDNQLFLNRGDGTFEEVTSDPIVSGGGASIGTAWGDMDGDGDLDGFVVNRNGGDNLLYRNRGDGTFEEVVGAPPVSDGGNSNSAAWVDLDADGDLDLFVLNFTEANFVYVNDGDGTFTRDDSPLIASRVGPSISATWADADGDLDLDVFFGLGSDQDNELYLNHGGGVFELVTDDPVVQGGGRTIGSSWGDVDNDGDHDLFVANTLGQDNRMYLNRGDGTFEEVVSGPVVSDGGNSVGSAFVDFDLDGDLDLVVGNDGGPVFWYRNRGDGSFTRVEGDALADYSGNTFGVAVGDADGDGDLDLFLADRLADNALFENLGSPGGWLVVELEGTSSNRSAIGARLVASATIGGRTVRQMRQVLPQSGYNSQDPLEIELGFGDATEVTRIEIQWPSGTVDVLRNVALGQRITVVEGSEEDPASRRFRRPLEVE